MSENYSPKMNPDNDSLQIVDAKSDKKVFIIVGLVFFLVAVVIFLISIYLYINRDKKIIMVPTDTATIMLRVGTLVDLPTDEAPQIAPIRDIAPFQSQPFFARARVGDMLIIYLKNHVAVLYSPEENKIINMSKISLVVPKPPVL